MIRRKDPHMKTKRIIAVLLAAITVLALSACNVKGSNYSDKNAYVSIYVYGMNKKTLFSNDAIRVAPQPPLEEEETTEGGLLTEESARQRYRTKPTGMLALEIVARSKDKNAELPTVVISQFNGDIEYTLDSVLNNTAGKAAHSNDIYEWEFRINDQIADPFTSDIKNYDKLTFSLVEKTFRNFYASFAITNGADTIMSETEYIVPGEKSEMTIANFLKGTYLNEKNEPVKELASELKITLSEDGKRVVKIGDLENDEENHFHWVCIMGEEYDDESETSTEILISDLSDTLISETDLITFDYREYKAEGEDTVEDTVEGGEEQPAE